MLVALLAIALVYTCYSILVLKHRNKKLQTELNSKTIIQPPPCPIKPIKLKACAEVNPPRKAILRNEIHDITTLFDYLRMRTDGLDSITDDIDPLSEVDDFIKENMIDLRDQKGLICTDGRYLLQYGKKNVKNKFILVEMKSPKMIQKFNYKYNQAVFESYWNKIGIDFLSSLSHSEVHNLVFNHAIYELISYVQHDAIHYTPSVRFKDIEHPADPIKQIRDDIHYPLNKTIEKYINDTLISIRNDFGQYTEIVGVDKNHNYYIGWSCENANYLIPINVFTEMVDKKTQPGNWLRSDDRTREMLDAIPKIKNKIANDTGYTVYNDVLGITFHKIEI